MDDAPAVGGTASDGVTTTPFVHVPAGGGSTVWLNGDVYSVKIGQEGSSGNLGLLEASVPPGGGPPMHNHTYEDEAFYIVEGELEIYIGDQTVIGRSGDFVFIPRNTMHGFRNKGLHTARQLLIFTPGGFERFFLETGRPAVPGVAVPHFQPSDNEHAIEVGRRYGSFQAQADSVG
ncbi:quercetin dioxygenase-like cupin family protein [Actinopolyspora lacussalsi]|nr:quercetin dioxygenase-like cupin family protein [Actinopolyspora lacussalsi]